MPRLGERGAGAGGVGVSGGGAVVERWWSTAVGSGVRKTRLSCVDATDWSYRPAERDHFGAQMASVCLRFDGKIARLLMKQLPTACLPRC